MTKRRKRVRDEEDIGSVLWEVWKAALIAVFACACLVMGIFLSQKISWKQEQKRLEIRAMQRQQAILDKKKVIDVWTWGHDFDLYKDGELRELKKMDFDMEYRTGELLMYDRGYDDRSNEMTPEEYDKLKHIYGFNQYRPRDDEDGYYADPILTFVSQYFLHVRYSADTGGDMVWGKTDAGLKTGTLKYISSEENVGECWSKSPISVKVSTNGMNGLEVGENDERIDEALRGYNTITYQKLSEAYPSVPEEYAGRTRPIYTSRVIVEAYKEDPRKIEAKETKPISTISIIIRRYGDWDLKKAEYDECVFVAPDMTQLEYSPYTSVELVW